MDSPNLTTQPADAMQDRLCPGEGPSDDSRSSAVPTILDIKWLPLLALAYVISIMPAYVGVLVLRSHGVDMYPLFEVLYSPILWMIDHLAWARGLSDLIEPILRSIAR